MKLQLLIAAVPLLAAPIARAESYVFYTAQCVHQNKVTHVIGDACLTEEAARADLEARASRLSLVCRESLTNLRDRRFDVSRPPLRADGCGPDVP